MHVEFVDKKELVGMEKSLVYFFLGLFMHTVLRLSKRDYKI